LGLQFCARVRELNLGWKLRDGQTLRNRFDKFISKQKPIGSTKNNKIGSKSNLFVFAVESIQASENQSQDL